MKHLTKELYVSVVWKYAKEHIPDTLKSTHQNFLDSNIYNDEIPQENPEDGHSRSSSLNTTEL